MDGQLVRAERVSRRVCVKDWVLDRTVCGEATFMLNHIFPVVPEPRVHRLLWSGFTSVDRPSRFIIDGDENETKAEGRQGQSDSVVLIDCLRYK